MEKFLYREESFKIGDACKAVWKQFGGSFKESIVDNALTIALENLGLNVENQKRVDISFSGKKVGTYVLDKVINELIVMEIKCKSYLTKEDEKQFWRYLRTTSYKVGFLIKFGSKLEIKRRVYDIARKQSNIAFNLA